MTHSHQATAAANGFEFQKYAGIYLMLKNFDSFKTLKIEGKNQDIEIEKDNGIFLFVQAKSTEKPYRHTFQSKTSSATTMGKNGLRWAEWRRDDSAVYFGIISTEAAGDKIIRGNNGVLGLYADDIDAAYAKCCELGVKILYKPAEVPGSKDHYRCFAIEDSDGNKIEISHYDR